MGPLSLSGRRRTFWPVALVAALAIGSASAVIEIVRAAVVGLMPGVEARDLRFIYSNSRERLGKVKPAVFWDLTAGSSTVASLAASAPDSTWMRIGGRQTAARGEAVSPSYFTVLRPRLVAGRAFSVGVDDGPAAGLMISERLWQREFGGSVDAIGATVRLTASRQDRSTERLYSIIGVVGDEFRGSVSLWEPSDYWVLLSDKALDFACPGGPVPREGASNVYVIARLLPGVADYVAADWFRRQLTPIRERRYPNEPEWSMAMTDAWSVALPYGLSAYKADTVANILRGLAVAVVVIGAVGVATLVAGRAIEARSEMAVRVALGASEWRLRRRLLLHVALPVALGTALSPPVAIGGIRVFLASLPLTDGERLSAPVLDRLAAGSILVLALLFAALAVLAAYGPVKRTILSPWEALLAHSEHLVAGHADRGRAALLGIQLAVTLAVVFIASDLALGVWRASRRGPGYDAERVAFVEFAQSSDRCRRPFEETAGAPRLLSEGMLRDAAAMPGVVAALSSSLPFANAGIVWLASTGDGSQRVGSAMSVSERYFDVLRLEPILGRLATDADGPDVAVVSSRIAADLWPTESPLGQQVGIAFHMGEQRVFSWHQVIGVVRDVASLGEARPIPSVYLPVGQHEEPTVLLVRDGTDSKPMLPRESEALVHRQGQGSEFFVVRSGWLADEMRGLMYPRRAAAAAATCAALVGLLLGAVGLYASVAYNAAGRSRELAVRISLGATSAHIVSAVARDAVRITGIATCFGVGLWYVCLAVLRSQGITAVHLDPSAAALGIVTASLVVGVSSFGPARRATRTGVATVLRE